MTCRDPDSKKDYVQDAHFLMIDIVKAQRKVTQVQTHHFDGQLGILKKSDAKFRAPGAPSYIGDLDRYVPPFAFVATAHQITMPENYALIAPSIISKLFDGPRKADVYLNPTTNWKDFVDVTVIFHDWLSTPDEQVYQNLYRALSEWPAAVHFPMMVDWRNGAQARANIGDRTVKSPHRWYTEAALNSVVVGREIGYVLARQSQLVNIHLIGVGLGAHAAHFAAEWFYETTGHKRRVDRLTAIDPSDYVFFGRYHIEHSDRYKYRASIKKVTTFVDMVHASFSVAKTNGYSSIESWGSVDIFINPQGVRNAKDQVDGFGLRPALCGNYLEFLRKTTHIPHCFTEAAVQAYTVTVEAINRRNPTRTIAERCDDFTRIEECDKARRSYLSQGKRHQCDATFGHGMAPDTIPGQYGMKSPPFSLPSSGASTSSGASGSRSRRSLYNSSFVDSRNIFTPDIILDYLDQLTPIDVIGHNRSGRAVTPPQAITRYPFKDSDYTKTPPFVSGRIFDR